MKTLASILMAALAFSMPVAAAPKKAAAKAEADEPSPEEKRLPRWVVILGVYKTFPEAKADGQKFAKAGKIPFSMNGMIFDKKGLRYPENHDDPVWAGEYLARRGNAGWDGKHDLDQHISVERSDGYEGFAKGFYILVGHIADNKEDGLAQEKTFKAFAPDTYVKKTRIYMGCLH